MIQLTRCQQVDQKWNVTGCVTWEREAYSTLNSLLPGCMMWAHFLFLGLSNMQVSATESAEHEIKLLKSMSPNEPCYGFYLDIPPKLSAVIDADFQNWLLYTFCNWIEDLHSQKVFKETENQIFHSKGLDLGKVCFFYLFFWW